MINNSNNDADEIDSSCSFTRPCQIDINKDLGRSSGDRKTYAVWSVSPVPVPAAIWLFGTALIGLVGFNKRKASTS